MRWRHLFFLIIVFNQLIFADPLIKQPSNRLYFFGNGERVENGKTVDGKGMFVPGYQVATRVNRNFWQTNFVFTPDVKCDQKCVDTHANQSVKPFTARNFNDQLKKIEDDLKSNNLKKDDQVMIVLQTHGGQANGEHWITFTDGDYDTLKLKSLVDMASAKGIKVGILDLSCYSSATLKIANKNTCVITGGDSANLSYMLDVQELLAQLQKSDNLQEAYENTLEINKNSELPGHNLISTQPSRRAQGIVGESMLAILKTAQDVSNKISASNAPLSTNECDMLTSNLRELQNVFLSLQENLAHPELSKFSKTTVERIYYTLSQIHKMNQYRKEIGKIKIKSQSFCKNPNECEELFYSLFVNEEAIRYDLASNGKLSEYSSYEQALNSDDFKKYSLYRAAEVSLYKETQKSLVDFNKAFRKEYLALYRAEKNHLKPNEQENACTRFKLR